MTKTELFLQLAKPGKDGISRWVDAKEFRNEYSELKLGNGASWSRKESSLAKKYKVEFDKSITPGNSIDRIRLNGLLGESHTQSVRTEIKNIIKTKRCVVLNISQVEVDHKNGRKLKEGGDPKVLNLKTQKLDDFQPLSKAANDAKRQHCKVCAVSGNRFDAKSLGYKKSFYLGTIKHSGKSDGCIGCFWFDPLEFRKNL